MLASTVKDVSEEMSIFNEGEFSKVAKNSYLLEIIEQVKDSTYAEKVKKVRSHPKNSEGRKRAKKALGSFTVSGIFSKNRQGFPDAHTGLMQVDLDGQDNPKLAPDQMREKVINHPSLVACFTSPSGDGLKLIMKVGVASDTTDHKHRFTSIAAEMEKLGLKLDPNGKDPARLCYFSHDPSAFYRPAIEAEELPLIQLPSEAIAKEWLGEGVHYPLPIAKRALEAIKSTLENERPDYELWLGLTAGMNNSYGSKGLALMMDVFPAEKPNDYENKLRDLPKAYNSGFIINKAKELAGWEASSEEKAALYERKKKDPIETAKGVALPSNGGSDFNPTAIFYDSPRGAYLVDTGTIYRTYSRKAPVKIGVTQFFRALGLAEKEAKELSSRAMDFIETRQAVDWSGNIAGKKKGAIKLNGLNGLILASPDLPEAKEGRLPNTFSIFEQAFPDVEERRYFLSWLSGRVKAVRSGIHQPSPLLVMAGEANTGKSLLAFIIQLCLGGRVANPMTTWSGAMTWNDDLLGSELLLIDDSNAPLGHKERQNLKANFKEFIFSDGVSIKKRNTSTITTRPVSTVVICCNKTPEALAAVPPIEQDSEDKIALVIVQKVKTPVPTNNPEGRAKLQEILRAELPAFLYHLEQREIPEELRDSRTGVRAWKNPELLNIIEGNKPETMLEELLRVAGKRGLLANEWFSAGEVASKLKAFDSPVKAGAMDLLQYHTNTGTYLTALHTRGSEIVTGKKTIGGTTFYHLEVPPSKEDHCF